MLSYKLCLYRETHFHLDKKYPHVVISRGTRSRQDLEETLNLPFLLIENEQYQSVKGTGIFAVPNMFFIIYLLFRT